MELFIVKAEYERANYLVIGVFTDETLAKNAKERCDIGEWVSITQIFADNVYSDGI